MQRWVDGSDVAKIKRLLFLKQISILSHMYTYMQTLRELAELLIGRLPVWSCDREVATATLLFTTHCTQCIESLCSENIPTTLQTRVSPTINDFNDYNYTTQMAYMRHRVGYGSAEVCLPKVRASTASSRVMGRCCCRLCPLEHTV